MPDRAAPAAAVVDFLFADVVTDDVIDLVMPGKVAIDERKIGIDEIGDRQIFDHQVTENCRVSSIIAASSEW